MSVALPPLALWSETPALEPPPGVESNFTDPEDRGSIILIVGSTLLALMILLYSVRMYTKFFVIGKLSWDDCKFIHS